MKIRLRWPAKIGAQPRKLLLSLGANMVTRVPGALGVIFFLPLLRFGLGIEAFGQTLAALSAGTVAGLLFGGIGTLSRRAFGESYAEGNERAQADAFRQTLAIALVSLLPSLAILIGYIWLSALSPSLFFVALLALLAGFGNIFDNIRAAYNEHYVTASIQFLFQIIFYALGFAIAVFQRNPILAAIVMQMPAILASSAGLVLLLIKRPYLLHGQNQPIGRILARSTVVALADGYLVSTLNLVVVLIQITEPATTSAWFGATIRVFQTFLVPVTLVALPLASYIRILWSSRQEVERFAILRLTVVISAGYGALVAGGMFLTTTFYIEAQMHLVRPGHTWLLPVLLLFATIVVYRCFSLIAYMVLDLTYLSRITMISLLLASAIGIAVGLVAGGLAGMSAYGIAGSAALLAVLALSLHRYRRSIGSTTIAS